MAAAKQSARGAPHAAVLTLLGTSLAACAPGMPAVATTGEPPAGQRGAADADPWLGQWNGPEGTFLRIAGGRDGGTYEITIRNLDGASVFHGNAAGGRIRFERDGIAESLTPGDGRQTGMKWLAGKSLCLVVHPGEGYCRD